MNNSFCTSISALNYVACERIDPIFSLITGGAWSPALYIQYQLAVLAMGMLWCLYQSKRFRFAPLAAVVFSILALIFLLGSEPLYFTACWFPLFLGSLERYAQGRSIAPMLTAIASGLLLVWSAAAIAPLLIFIATLFLLWRKVDVTGPTCGLLFLFGIVALVQLPGSPFPSYPPGARVAPLSPLTVSQPIILAGPEHGLNPLLFGPYETATKVFALNTAVVFSLLLFAALAARVSILALWPLMVLGVLCGGEFLLNSSIYYSPFQTLRRLVPGLGLVLLPWSLALAFAVPTFLHIEGRLSAKLLWGLSAAMLVVFGLQVGLLPPKLTPGMFSVSTQAANLVTHSDRVNFSPSSFVANEVGAWSIVPGIATERASARLLVQPQDFVWSVSGSSGAEKALLAIDGKDSTRWSTGHAQKAGDSFTVTFDREVQLIKAELSVRSTPTDFPRGFKVEGSLDGSTFTTITSFDDWHGPLRWTEANFPYFGPPHDVTIQFPQTTRLKVLRFVLTAGDPLFDWSIGELRVYAPAALVANQIAESAGE